MEAGRNPGDLRMHLLPKPDCLGRKPGRENRDSREPQAEDLACPVPVPWNETERGDQDWKRGKGIIERSMQCEDQAACCQDPLVGHACQHGKGKSGHCDDRKKIKVSIFLPRRLNQTAT